MKYNDRFRLYSSNFTDQTILTFRQMHMASVIAFGFKAVRKSGADHDFVCGFYRVECFLCESFFITIFISRKSLDVSDILVFL